MASAMAMYREDELTIKRLPVETEPAAPSHEDIARLAHILWLERGEPVGSPDEYWLRAESLLALSRQ